MCVCVTCALPTQTFMNSCPFSKTPFQGRFADIGRLLWMLQNEGRYLGFAGGDSEKARICSRIASSKTKISSHRPPQRGRLLNGALGLSRKFIRHDLGVCHAEAARQKHAPSGFVKTSAYPNLLFCGGPSAPLANVPFVES